MRIATICKPTCDAQCDFCSERFRSLLLTRSPCRFTTLLERFQYAGMVSRSCIKLVVISFACYAKLGLITEKVMSFQEQVQIVRRRWGGWGWRGRTFTGEDSLVAPSQTRIR